MQERWVKVYESALESEVFADPWLWKLFSWCLLKANFKDRKIAGKMVKRGSFVTGRNIAAEELNCHPSRWYRGIQKLCELGCIEASPNKDRTTLTVCNYSDYQDVKVKSEQQSNSNRTAPEQQSNSARTASEQQSNTREERKKSIREEGKNAFSTEPPKASAVPDESELKFPNFPCTGEPRVWNLPESKVAQYAATFDTLDVPGELRRAWQWTLDNRAKRKTAGGMLRFLNAWLDKAANRGSYGRPPSPDQPHKPKLPTDEQNKNYSPY